MRLFTIIVILLFVPIQSYHIQEKADLQLDTKEAICNVPSIPSITNSDGFIENKGQIPGDISFFKDGNPKYALMDDSISITLDQANRGNTVVLEFPGSTPEPPKGSDPLSTRLNYFLGPNSLIDVPTYQNVVYKDLYNLIDLRVYSKGDRLKYDFIVHPGGDPSEIRIDYTGSEGIHILDGKNLRIDMGEFQLTDGPLVATQGNRLITSGYRIREEGIGVEITGWDRSKVLIIDPIIEASTFIGGNQWERYNQVEVDPWENVIIVGETDSNDFPTTAGSYDTVYGVERDLFVAKFDPELKNLLFATYLGGTNYEDFGGFSIGDDGDIYISGRTYSSDYPTTSDSFQSTYSGEGDGFLTCLSGSGNSIEYSTYIGGSSTDHALDIDLDSRGYPVLLFSTRSDDMYVTPECFQQRLTGTQNGYLMGMDSDGGARFATYFGGTRYFDYPYALKLDNQDRAVVVGQTSCLDYPSTSGSYDAEADGYDGFVTAFDRNGTELYFSTFLGKATRVKELEFTSNGTILLTGQTQDIKKGFPITAGAFDTIFSGKEEGFLSCLNENGSKLIFSTYLGATENKEGSPQEIYHEDCLDLDLDREGWIYVSGYTDAPDLYVTKGAHDKNLTERECILFMVSSDGRELKYCTYLGGFEEDMGTSIAVNFTNMAYITGSTYSNTHYTDFPVTSGVYDTTINGGYDTFVTMYKTDSFIPDPPTDLNYSVGDGFVNLTWNPPDFDGNEDIIGYNVYRGRWANEKYARVEEKGVEELYFNSTNLTNGDEYFFFVGSVNRVGEGYLSMINATPMTVPDAVDGIRSESGHKYINISWFEPYDGGASPMRYNVYLGDIPNNTLLLASGLDVRYHNITGLINGKRYFFRVSASNIMGEGKTSAVHNSTPYGIPSVPLDFNVDAGSGYANLTWSRPKDTGGSSNYSYEVYVISGGEPSFTIGKNIKEDYLNVSMTDGVGRSFAVRCRNVRGTGPFTDPISVLTLGPFSEPIGMTLNYTNGLVELNWTEPLFKGGASDFTYNVYMGNDPDELYRYAGNISDTSVKIADVERGITYYFRVHAYNGRWEGPGSEVGNITPYSVPSAPRNPEIRFGDKWIFLEWEPPSSSGGYNYSKYMVKWGTYPENLYYQRETGNLNANFTGIEMGITYYFTVFSLNPTGIGPNTEMVNVTPVLSPTSPARLRYDFGDGKILMDWGVPNDNRGSAVIGYIVYLGENPSSIHPLTDMIITRQYTILGLDNGEDYWISVSAINGVGEGPIADPIKATPMTTPSQPNRPHLWAGLDFVSVNWTYPADDGGNPVFLFHIYRNDSSGKMVKYMTLNSNERSFVDYEISPGNTYTYSLVAENSVGPSERSPDASISIEESEKDSDRDIDPKIALTGIGVMIIIVLIILAVAFLIIKFNRKRNLDNIWRSGYEGERSSGENQSEE
mgnify:CR=1 FL=1